VIWFCVAAIVVLAIGECVILAKTSQHRQELEDRIIRAARGEREEA
jgi:hypothetical protein